MSHSYHDLYITTAEIPRTSIFMLPFRVRVQCTRAAGWEVWAVASESYPEELLGAEYGSPGNWLRLDVAGHVIVNSEPVLVAQLAEAAASNPADV